MAKRTKQTKKTVFEVGDFVLAKIKGYSYWPAQVTQVINSKTQKYVVKFFRTQQIGTSFVDIKPYNASDPLPQTMKPDILKAYEECRRKYNECTKKYKNGTKKHDEIVETSRPRGSPKKNEAIVATPRPRSSPKKREAIVDTSPPQDSPKEHDEVVDTSPLQDSPKKQDEVVDTSPPQDSPKKNEAIVTTPRPRGSPKKREAIVDTSRPRGSPKKHEETVDTSPPQDSPKEHEIVDTSPPQDSPRKHEEIVDTTSPLQDCPKEHDEVVDASRSQGSPKKLEEIVDVTPPLDSPKEHEEIMDTSPPRDSPKEHEEIMDTSLPRDSLSEPVDCSLNDLTGEQANADRGIEKPLPKSEVIVPETNKTIEKLKKKLQEKLVEKEDKKKNAREKKEFEKASNILPKFIKKFQSLTAACENFSANPNDEIAERQVKVSIKTCESSLEQLNKCVIALSSEYGRKRKETEDFHNCLSKVVTCLKALKYSENATQNSGHSRLFLRKMKKCKELLEFINSHGSANERKEQLNAERKENARKRIKLSR